MERHILTLRYDGLLASSNELAPSASGPVVPGARLLLGAHAHYYLRGVIPERINERGPGYEITDLARRAGSWEANFAINFLSTGLWELVSFGFGYFLRTSMKAWLEGRTFEDPPFERREPYLGIRDGGNEPFFDHHSAQRHQQQRLSRRIGHAMAQLTTGLGSSATTLEMSVDGLPVAAFDRRVLRYSEDEVTEGISLIRQTVDVPRGRLS